MCKQALLLREVEYHQEALVRIPDFVVLNAFKRLDRGDKDYITSLDILLFLKENGVIMGEQECYMLVSAFDSNKDNQLSFAE
jgi:dipeptidase